VRARPFRKRWRHRGAHGEHLEEVARDERAEHQAPVDAAIDIWQRRVGVDEDIGLATERVELRERERLALAVGGPQSLHGEHLVHVRYRIDAKQQRVEHREGHGDQAEPERHREHDGEGDERRALERAQCIEDVADRVVDEGGAARIAALVLDLLDAAKHPACMKARRFACHATRLQPLRLAVEMEPQFLAQIGFSAMAQEQGSQPGLEPMPEAHGFKSSAARE
jgi:hypothetical protein